MAVKRTCTCCSCLAADIDTALRHLCVCDAHILYLATPNWNLDAITPNWRKCAVNSSTVSDEHAGNSRPAHCHRPCIEYTQCAPACCNMATRCSCIVAGTVSCTRYDRHMWACSSVSQNLHAALTPVCRLCEMCTRAVRDGEHRSDTGQVLQFVGLLGDKSLHYIKLQAQRVSIPLVHS